MKNISKRFISLIRALALAMACYVPAFAMETDEAQALGSSSSEAVSPLSTDWYAAVWLNDTSKTTETSSTFVTTARARMSAEVSLSAPCVLYIGFRDSNGKVLGISSFEATYPGTFTIELSPATLSPGSYSVYFYFDRSGVTYNLFVKATTAF